jgi:hypothetical protein
MAATVNRYTPYSYARDRASRRQRQNILSISVPGADFVGLNNGTRYSIGQDGTYLAESGAGWLGPSSGWPPVKHIWDAGDIQMHLAMTIHALGLTLTGGTGMLAQFYWLTDSTPQGAGVAAVYGGSGVTQSINPVANPGAVIQYCPFGQGAAGNQSEFVSRFFMVVIFASAWPTVGSGNMGIVVSGT